jgi:hypothetical protein
MGNGKKNSEGGVEFGGFGVGGDCVLNFFGEVFVDHVGGQGFVWHNSCFGIYIEFLEVIGGGNSLQRSFLGSWRSLKPLWWAAPTLQVNSLWL